jgi:hypothetical protein
MLTGDDRGKPASLVWRQPLSSGLQEGWIANRHLRHVQARLADQLADQLADNFKTYGAATILAVMRLQPGSPFPMACSPSFFNVGTSLNEDDASRRMSPLF